MRQKQINMCAHRSLQCSQEASFRIDVLLRILTQAVVGIHLEKLLHASCLCELVCQAGTQYVCMYDMYVTSEVGGSEYIHIYIYTYIHIYIHTYIEASESDQCTPHPFSN